MGRYIFLAIIFSFALVDLLWWWWADRRLRRVKARRGWRIAVAAFSLLMAGLIVAWVFSPTLVRRTDTAFFSVLNLLIFGWHLLMVPVAWLLAGLFSLWTLGAWAVGKLRRREPTAPPDEPVEGGPQSPPAPRITRRDMIGAAAVALPPLLLGGAAIRGASNIGRWRIHPIDVALPTLPAALDGMTIAHVSDSHIGRYTTPAMLRRIAESVNQLRADLVLMTGDLIDYSLSHLPEALEMIRRFDPKYGMALCCGNHDMFDDPWSFIARTRQAGVNMLVGDWRMLSVRGVPIEVAGIEWTSGDSALSAAVARVTARRSPRDALSEGAFPILLSHHPHGFDPAASAGFPLTLSGHTHGGQVMLTSGFGPATLIYRYVSGLYQKPGAGGAALVISNGVGNWFPLRFHAPAEITYITLHRSA